MILYTPDLTIALAHLSTLVAIDRYTKIDQRFLAYEMSLFFSTIAVDKFVDNLPIGPLSRPLITIFSE